MIQSDLTSLSSIQPLSGKRDKGISGVSIASIIIGVWAISLITLLSVEIPKLHVLALSLVLWQTFLYTGLFITAHDAMHGVVFPKSRKVNHLIGAIALFFYGFFPYRKMLKKHGLHHHHPASDLDPDYHNGDHANFFAWYFHFMKGYWSWLRFLALVATFHGIHLLLHVPEVNLCLFWIIPSLLSSVQLFYFGTFLPHQEPKGGYTNPSRARSNPLPFLWSFLTCYHFGYHQEHHECPDVPWWQLPEVYKIRRELAS